MTLMSADRLMPDARLALEAGPEAQIAFLRKSPWTPYPAATNILNDMQVLFDSSEDGTDHMSITSHSRNGKSWLIKPFLGRYPPADSIEEGAARCPVFVMSLPAYADRRLLWLRVAQLAHIRVSDRTSTSNLETSALLVLKALGVRMLVIDQFEHCFQKNERRGDEVLHVIKDAAMFLNAVIVAVGMPIIAGKLLEDEQIDGRFDPYVLPRWKKDTTTSRFLSSLERNLPLPLASGLGDEAITSYVVDQSDGTLKWMSLLIRTAAIAAIKTHKTHIDLPLLQALSWKVPSARRRTARREARDEMARHRVVKQANRQS